jgi:hypothetical protein
VTDDEITKSGNARKRLRSVDGVDPDTDDLRVLYGRLMAACARNEQTAVRLERKVDELMPFASDVLQMRRDWDADRDALVHGASKRAANHSSNRMAALMGALFTLYELTSPYVRDLVHWWLHK